MLWCILRSKLGRGAYSRDEVHLGHFRYCYWIDRILMDIDFNHVDNRIHKQPLLLDNTRRNLSRDRWHVQIILRHKIMLRGFKFRINFRMVWIFQHLVQCVYDFQVLDSSRGSYSIHHLHELLYHSPFILKHCVWRADLGILNNVFLLRSKQYKDNHLQPGQSGLLDFRWFPFNSANFGFNDSLPFELCVLKARRETFILDLIVDELIDVLLVRFLLHHSDH